MIVSQLGALLHLRSFSSGMGNKNFRDRVSRHIDVGISMRSAKSVFFKYRLIWFDIANNGRGGAVKQVSKSIAFLVLLNISAAGATQAAFADRGNVTIKSGSGTEMVLKKGYFGGQEQSITDKRGNKIGRKKSGLFGTTQETEVSFFGTGIKKKKGLFGGTQYEGKTILGDSITSKKGLFGFGRRNTTVDISGTTGLVKQFIGSKKLPPLFDPAGSGSTAAQKSSAGAISGISQQDAADLLNNTQMPGSAQPPVLSNPPQDTSPQDNSSSTY